MGYQNYGFLFQVLSDGPYVQRVEKDSAAESAGLQPLDKIIEVNGVNVELETRDKILLRMKSFPNEMKLLVVDMDTLHWFDRRGIKLNSSLPMVKKMATRQRSPGECDSDSIYTLMCVSIGTPKNNKFSICSKWKIHYF